jgi:hypothetical protein
VGQTVINVVTLSQTALSTTNPGDERAGSKGFLHDGDSPKTPSGRIQNFIKSESEPKLHAETQNS